MHTDQTDIVFSSFHLPPHLPPHLSPHLPPHLSLPLMFFKIPFTPGLFPYMSM
jgi:hypothetical protein